MKGDTTGAGKLRLTHIELKCKYKICLKKNLKIFERVEKSLEKVVCHSKR